MIHAKGLVPGLLPLSVLGAWMPSSGFSCWGGMGGGG